MTYSANDLAEHVLRKLRVVDAGEAQADIESELLSIVTTTYTAKWEELAAHGQELVYWPMNEIPRPVLLVLRDLIALEVQDHFGDPIKPEDKEAREVIILKRLRRHTSTQSSGKQTTANFY